MLALMLQVQKPLQDRHWLKIWLVESRNSIYLRQNTQCMKSEITEIAKDLSTQLPPAVFSPGSVSLQLRALQEQRGRGVSHLPITRECCWLPTPSSRGFASPCPRAVWQILIYFPSRATLPG